MVISRTDTAGTENHEVPLRNTQCLSDADRSLNIAVDDCRWCIRWIHGNSGVLDLFGEAKLETFQRIGILCQVQIK